MRIIPRAFSGLSTADARQDTEPAVRQVQAEIPPQLIALVEAALGSDVAAIHLAWVRALARANPHIAAAFLAEELRKWALIAAAAAPV